MKNRPRRGSLYKYFKKPVSAPTLFISGVKCQDYLLPVFEGDCLGADFNVSMRMTFRASRHLLVDYASPASTPIHDFNLLSGSELASRADYAYITCKFFEGYWKVWLHTSLSGKTVNGLLHWGQRVPRPGTEWFNYLGVPIKLWQYYSTT